jgi:hypothetical protein
MTPGYRFTEMPFGALRLLRAGFRPAGENARLQHDTECKGSGQITKMPGPRKGPGIRVGWLPG